MRRYLHCFCIGGLFIASTTALAGGASFPLHTAGPYIVDSNGHRVRINAVNWYGTESTDFVVGGLQESTLADIVQQIKNAGFNAVRLPWSNQMYELNPAVGNYALRANPGLLGKHALSIFDQVVNTLASAGLMVILDNHNSNAEWCCGNDGNELWYNSSYPETSWIKDWQGMVQRYANQQYVIGVDLRNEPRHTATWGGSSSTDWHAAAQRGGNAVLSVHSNSLIFVEGIGFGANLSGVSTLPIKLNVANRLVYSAHDYGFENPGLTGYSDWVTQITKRWGFLVTGSNPQPFWLGEFGTCNTSNTCVSSTSNSQNGYWFHIITTYLARYSVDWAYWPLNGTNSSGRGYGSVETYGVLNTTWNGIALPALGNALHQLASSSSGPAEGTYRIVNSNSGLAMEPSGASLSTGANVDQWQYANAANQQWTLTSVGDGAYMVANRDSGLCLDITGESISAGGPVEQWTYWGGANQQFVITPTPNGNWRIVNAKSGLVVEVPSQSTADGTNLDQWFANGGTHQQWSFLAP